MTMHSDDVIGSQNTFSPLSLVTIYAAPAGVSSVNIWLSNLDRFTKQMQKQIFECAHSSDQALLDRRDKRLRAAAVLAQHAVTPCFVLCLLQKCKRFLRNVAYAPAMSKNKRSHFEPARYQRYMRTRANTHHSSSAEKRYSTS
jgi:hypothetical protein